MKYIQWIVIGCLCIGIPFFIGYDPYDLWRSVMFGMAGGMIFMITVYFFWIKKNFAFRVRILIASIMIVFSIAFSAYSAIMFRMSTYQRETMGLIRMHLATNIILDEEIYGRTMPVFRAYHSQMPKSKRPITEMFRQRYDAKIKNGVFQSDHPISKIWSFVRYQGDSLVNIVCIDSASKGYRNDFISITGQTGILQISATLTTTGVKYERVN